MNENYSDDISMTDWERLEVMQDEDIDTSDIAPLDESFFANAELRMPKTKKIITMRVDPEVLEWFRAQGKGYQTRMNAVLRMYMEANVSKS